MLCCFKRKKKETNLFEKSRLEDPISWEGEPVPDREEACILEEFKLPDMLANGDRKDEAGDGSLGDGVPEGDTDRVWLADCEW
jgi:hypothetical protein